MSFKRTNAKHSYEVESGNAKSVLAAASLRPRRKATVKVALLGGKLFPVEPDSTGRVLTDASAGVLKGVPAANSAADEDTGEGHPKEPSLCQLGDPK